MLRVNQIVLTPDCDNYENIKKAVLKKTALTKSDIEDIQILKRSIDARKTVKINYSVAVKTNEAAKKKALKNKDIQIYVPKTLVLKKAQNRKKKVVVCGFGPAGMFAALTFAKCGITPIVIERGSEVEKRAKKAESFFCGGALDEQCNIQFGEGGAGAFSDGKLNTGIHDERLLYILKTFVLHGAPKEIIYSAKPHVGTDILRKVVASIRNELINSGAEILFDTKLSDINIKDGQIKSVYVLNGGKKDEIECDALVAAVGHSARDTFEMFYEKNIVMQQKPFAIGVRAEHPQSFINEAQYKDSYLHEKLGAADYKLWTHLKNGRGVYSFCMCPGGIVVGATSEKECVVTNGMSYYKRDGKNANAAILCDVRPSDFNTEHVLGGMYFQRMWEKRAYIAGQRSYKAPVSLMGDFIKKRTSKEFGNVLPTYLPGCVFADLNECLPGFVSESIREAIGEFDKKIKGYNMYDAVLTGIETRSSSPVRILRDENFESVSVKGLYPCGEGAGYAGGIMSAAADGIKVAQAICEKE